MSFKTSFVPNHTITIKSRGSLRAYIILHPWENYYMLEPCDKHWKLFRWSVMKSIRIRTKSPLPISLKNNPQKAYVEYFEKDGVYWLSYVQFVN